MPTYDRVKFEGVYPGVDLVFYGNQRQLEHDFVVSPRADASPIAFRLEGSKKVSLDAEGNLVVVVEGGEVRLQKPLIYQEGSGARREIPGGYVLKGAREVAFKVGAYDPTRPPVIDPAIAYSTYLGSSATDDAEGIAVDSAGNAYVTGVTGASFPTTPGAYQNSLASGGNVYVTKLDTSGSALIYSTYLGGSYEDLGGSIALDSSGNAYVTGGTYSTDFPRASPLQDALEGAQNAFVTELNPTGSTLVYSTYLGGSGTDYGNGVAIDAGGNAYVVGSTTSPDFPGVSSSSIQPTYGGGGDAFMSEVQAGGASLLYST